MRIEIDQSGKVEKTSKHTYLAFSNDEYYILKITAREKQRLQKYFRKIGKPKLFVYFTFVILLTILLKKIKNKNHLIVLDKEYPGQDHQIRELIKVFYPHFLIENISIRSVGKKSRAHFYAHGAAINKIKPNLVLNASDVLRVLNKKPGNA